MRARFALWALVRAGMGDRDTTARVRRARCVHPPVFRDHYGSVDQAALDLELLGYVQRHGESIVVGFNARHLAGHDLYPSRHRSREAHDFPRDYDGFFRLDWRLSVNGGPEQAPFAPGSVPDERGSTLVLEFRVATSAGAEVANLTAVDRRRRGEVVVAWAGVDVCAESPAAAAGGVRAREAPAELAVCTMVLVGGADNANVRTSIAPILTWIEWYAAQGAALALVYLDTAAGGTAAGGSPSEAEAKFADDLEAALRDAGGGALDVVLVDWRFADKNFATQILMQSHCLRSSRDHATYVLNTDIDELVQARPRGTILDAARDLFGGDPAAAPSAVLVPMRWRALPGGLADAPVFDMGAYGLASAPMADGNGAKVLFKPADVGYFGVHVAGNVRTRVVLLDGDGPLVVNHFKGFGTAQLNGAFAPEPTWAEAWAAFVAARPEAAAPASAAAEAARPRVLFVNLARGAEDEARQRCWAEGAVRLGGADGARAWSLGDLASDPLYAAATARLGAAALGGDAEALWKPLIILRALEELLAGGWVIYSDVVEPRGGGEGGCVRGPWRPLLDWLDSAATPEAAFAPGAYLELRNGDHMPWVPEWPANNMVARNASRTADLFGAAGVDGDARGAALDARHLQTSWMVFRNSPGTAALVREWFDLAANPRTAGLASLADESWCSVLAVKHDLLAVDATSLGLPRELHGMVDPRALRDVNVLLDALADPALRPGFVAADGRGPPDGRPMAWGVRKFQLT